MGLRIEEKKKSHCGARKEKTMKRSSVALAMLVVGLSGCAPTTGTNREYDIPITVSSNHAATYILLEMKVDATSATDQTATPVISPTTRMQLTEGGSTAGGDASPMSEIQSKLENVLDSFNTTKTKTTTTTSYKDNEDNTVKDEKVDEQVDTGKEEVSDDLDYKNKATFDSYGVRNGRQAWRIAGKGPSFGEPVKFVFSSGKTYIVKDTDKNCRGADPDACDIPSDQNKDGFVFKPGIGPNGEGDTNTGTSHGGIYLHAPYDDNSKTVTLYYNKP